MINIILFVERLEREECERARYEQEEIERERIELELFQRKQKDMNMLKRFFSKYQGTKNAYLKSDIDNQMCLEEEECMGIKAYDEESEQDDIRELK